MSELELRCEVCRALVDEEDLFCANCGTEAPHPPGAPVPLSPQSQLYTHAFDCLGCGASMSYDAQAQALRCPFCGSLELEQQADTRGVEPRRVVPFAIDRQQALAVLRKWLGTGFWRPGDLSHRAAVAKMAPVFVPYWIFSAHTHTYWTADTSQTPAGARGDWYPLWGEHHGRYESVLIGASGVLTPAETAALGPYDLQTALSPDSIDLDPFVVEQFRVQRKYARPLARTALEGLEQRSCQPYVPGRCRNLKVNVKLDRLGSEPVLLPVWVMAYKYQDRLFRFLLNGQTGVATGSAPVSWKKVIAVALISAGALLALLLTALLWAALS